MATKNERAAQAAEKSRERWLICCALGQAAQHCRAQAEKMPQHADMWGQLEQQYREIAEKYNA